jgi:predicted acyltransferase
MKNVSQINQVPGDQNQNRLLSLDFFRGFVMLLLVSGIGQLFGELVESGKGGAILAFINRQSNHGEWFELYFWDLIQPFFMYIVGVAIPFSLAKREARGESWKNSFYHALIRSFWLLVLGFMLGATEKTYYLTNILPQLSFTYVIGFLLVKKNIKWQIGLSFFLILISDLLYRFWPVEGFNQPFVVDHNFGSWFDMATVGHLHPYHWVTFNAVPTAAHIIWGVITGEFLMKKLSNNRKVITLLIIGLTGIITGYCMNPVIPIIERISTSSYVIVSGGYCFAAMALSFWLVDMMNFKKIATFFAIAGMNPIFIYVFSSIGGKQLLSRMAIPFTARLFKWGGPIFVNMVTIVVVAAMVWYITYFLYKRKIFFKL